MGQLTAHSSYVLDIRDAILLRDIVSHNHTQRDAPPHVAAILRVVALMRLFITTEEADDEDPKLPSSDDIMQVAASIKKGAPQLIHLVRVVIKSMRYF